MPTLVPPQVLERELVGSHSIFELWRLLVRFGDEDPRATGPTRMVQLRMPDWVTVVAVTTEREVVLVEQHRWGVEQTVVETPGGIIDPGEQPIDAAARELREETGFVAERLETLGWIHPNPAIQNNRLHVVLARGARRAGPACLEPHERIETRLVPEGQVQQMLASGEICHALVIVALVRGLARIDRDADETRALV